jgi:predicted transcriptional regulator
MNTYIFSVSPQEAERIANGEQTVLVRLRTPEAPFKAVMYCKNGVMLHDNLRCGIESIQEDVKSGKLKRFVLSAKESNNVICSSYPFVNRKVIGEFVCNKVDIVFCEEVSTDVGNFFNTNIPEMAKLACVSNSEIESYIGDYGKALHITSPRLYDKPKELTEFRTLPCKKSEKYCEKCKFLSVKESYYAKEVECFVEMEDQLPALHRPTSKFKTRRI